MRLYLGGRQATATEQALRIVRRRARWVGVALAAGALIPTARVLPAKGDPWTTEDALRAAVVAFGKAFEEADVDVLDTLLIDGYTHTNGRFGTVLDRDQWLAWISQRRVELKSGRLVVHEHEIEDLAVQLYGDAAIVTFVAKSSGRRDNVDFSSRVRCTTVWVLADRQWRRAAFHDSALPE